MTLPALALVTAMIGVGSYLAFGARAAGYFLLGFAVIQIAANATRRP